MKIKINDRTVELPDGLTVAQVLDHQEIKPARTATALNGEVVPAARRAEVTVSDGDSLLVITAFYGG